MTGQSDSIDRKRLIRLLKLLSKKPVAGYRLERNADHVRIFGDQNDYTFQSTDVDYCSKQQWISSAGGKAMITDSGKAFLLRSLHPDIDYRVQHMEFARDKVLKNGESTQVKINRNESPLSRLYYRKDKTGASWLDEYEFKAGERLRSDFEKSQLQPRISANWEHSPASKSSSSGDRAEISDFALDARKRVEKSVVALGPELSDVAMDVCCFLKGLEAVERERNWPPRSAKLMLRTALRQLVLHYGLRLPAHKTQIGHWGSKEYRPARFV